MALPTLCVLGNQSVPFVARTQRTMLLSTILEIQSFKKSNDFSRSPRRGLMNKSRLLHAAVQCLCSWSSPLAALLLFGLLFLSTSGLQSVLQPNSPVCHYCSTHESLSMLIWTVPGWPTTPVLLPL